MHKNSINKFQGNTLCFMDTNYIYCQYSLHLAHIHSGLGLSGEGIDTSKYYNLCDFMYTPWKAKLNSTIKCWKPTSSWTPIALVSQRLSIWKPTTSTSSLIIPTSSSSWSKLLLLWTWPIWSTPSHNSSILTILQHKHWLPGYHTCSHLIDI